MTRPQRYTVYEINRMRDALAEARSWFGSSRSAEQVERELLTHMANGTTADEVEAYRDEAAAQQDRKGEWERAEDDIRRRLCTHPHWGRDSYWGEPTGPLRCRACGQPDRRKTPRDEVKPEPVAVVSVERKRRFWR